MRDEPFFVTIRTKTMDESYERRVTIALGWEEYPTLLGNLEHNTSIIVDQKLVDDLQALVDYMSERKERDHGGDN